MASAFRAALVFSTLFIFSGCGALQEKVAREDISGATLRFDPDVVRGNVDYWWYEFDTLGKKVVGCNSNGNVYNATSWEIDEENSTVTVYFGSAYEEYKLSASDSSLESGRFDYDNSNGGQEMTGDWKREYTKPCSNK